VLHVKHKVVTGQRSQTRAQAQLAKVKENIDLHADRYRHARKAHLTLFGPGNWEKTLKELQKEDLQLLTSHQDEDLLTSKDGPREGYRMTSWIYMAPSATDTQSPEYIEGIFVTFYIRS
jgi:hypothetical protein